LIEAQCTGIWFGKPPLKEHLFDVTLRNPSPEPRWLLVPETFPYEGDTKPAIGDGNLAELQIFETSKHPRTVVAQAVGSHFWAIRLVGHGTVTLRQLPISSWWENLPDSVDLPVVVASEVLVGGQPMASCFPGDPLSESGADVQAPSDAADKRALHFWHPEDRTPAPNGKAPYDLPVEVREVQRALVRVSICRSP